MIKVYTFYHVCHKIYSLINDKAGLSICENIYLKIILHIQIKILKYLYINYVWDSTRSILHKIKVCKFVFTYLSNMLLVALDSRCTQYISRIHHRVTIDVNINAYHRNSAIVVTQEYWSMCTMREKKRTQLANIIYSFVRKSFFYKSCIPG